MTSKAEHQDIKDRFRERISHNNRTNKLKYRGDFLDIGYVMEELTIPKIKALLEEDFPDRAEEDYERWAEVIHNRLRKSYAILILADNTHLIEEFNLQSVEQDDHTLFRQPFLSREHYEEYSFPWNPRNSILAKVLDENQWFIPPQLSSHVHQTFPARHFRFPFVNQPTRIGHGGFGNVFQVEIADGHIEYTAEYNSDSPLVYKSVEYQPERGMDWNRLLCEVRTLRDRKHNNVTPLLSSFAAGNAEAHLENDNQEKLYMILPRAVGTLAEWMTSDEPPYLTNLQIRREYIYEIMFSLASGVAYIHREINHIVGFHHDLKPTNILNFPGEDRPVWKICDFGGSNLKDAVEETGTSHYIHTVLYTPEEFFVPDGSKHGRAYDVFSLGCIILELATLCRYGWSEIGLPEFEKRRFEHCKDHEVRKDHKIAYYRSPNVVKKWMTELGEKQDSKGFCELLNLIEQMLLVPRFQRIFAWEVEVDLVWIKNPEVGPDDALVLERLREVVQSPRKPSNAISSAHNPLMRAIRLGRSHEVQEILRNAQWSDISPGVTKELLHSQPRHVGRYYSTLVSPQGSSPLYGRQKEYNWLQRKFKDRNTLGLYGLGGIGKSHLALYYAEQFRDTTESSEKKHTFWVHAGNNSDIMASYSEIANQIEEIRAQRLTDTLLYSAVRTWLENPRNGPWIMVVDGLDSERTADILKKEVLPRENKGQLLFTGRNPQCIEAACGHNVECLEIQKPHPDDCLKIFRSHLVDGYYDEAAQGTSQLLENLWLPLVIKMAAIHMNKFRIPHQKMCDQVNRTPFMFDQIRELDPNSSDPRKSFVNVFLGPLLEDSAPLPPASNGTKWGQELRLLCFLACLNKDKVTNRLIKANYKVEKHATVDTNLYKLVSYGFIEDIGKDTFRMHKFVQDSVIAYIRAKTGEDGLFLRFGVALGALVRRYDEKIKEERSEQAEWLYRSASSYAWKIPFMPHFARFVEMTSEAKSRGLSDKFIFQDRAVESIVTFSRVYMEQGRSEHAIEVLEFAQNHHRGNQAKVWLNQTLAQAYKARASTAKYSERRKYIDKAEVLFKALIKEADEVKLRFLKWDLVLELTRLYWESNECTKAWKQLESMQMFRFTLEEGRVVMVNDTVLMKELPKWNENDKKSRLLVIRVQYEEGLVHLETGNAHAAKGKLKLAIQSWTSAKEEFSKSTQALHTWLPDEKELLLQIEESIADADRAIGTPDLLEDAESKLKEHITLLRDNFKASDKRLWETECRLARVLSKGGHDKLEEAIELLVHLYESHSKHLGKESGETLKTASLLRDVYILAGQESKARELEITSGLEIEPRLEHSMRARTSNTLIGSNQLTIIAVVAWVTIAVPVCISTGILLLRKGKR